MTGSPSVNLEISVAIWVRDLDLKSSGAIKEDLEEFSRG